MPWKKGESGNPGGRVGVASDIRELARQHTSAALATLVRIAKDVKSPPAAQVAASNSLLDRGYGKPPQGLEHTGKDGGPIETLDVTDAHRARAMAAFFAKLRVAGKIS